MQLIAKLRRQAKFWEKFLGNWKYPFTSPTRFLIKLEKSLGFLLLWPLETLGDLIFWSQRPLPSQINRILIIKTDQLGDVLFSTILLKKIKGNYPQTKIDYLISPAAAPILANNPLTTNIYHWHNFALNLLPGRKKTNRVKSFSQPKKENRRVYHQLKENNYDVVINARAFWPSSNLKWQKITKYLIAFDISQFSFLADKEIDYRLKAEEWKNYYQLLSPLLAVDNQIEPQPIFFNISNQIFCPDPYICISPVSYDLERTWPKKQWQELIDLIISTTNYKIILLGLPHQKDWLEGVHEPNERIQILNNLKIDELASVIKRAKAFIGIDSFSAHLAHALNTPAFCLVNTKLFYVPGLSQQKIVDGRCMLSNSQKLKLYPLRKTKPEDINQALKNNNL